MRARKFKSNCKRTAVMKRRKCSRRHVYCEGGKRFRSQKRMPSLRGGQELPDVAIPLRKYICHTERLRSIQPNKTYYFGANVPFCTLLTRKNVCRHCEEGKNCPQINFEEQPYLQDKVLKNIYLRH